MEIDIARLNATAEKYSKSIEKIKEEIRKVIVGQSEALDKLLTALIADGHVLIEGVPGLAKTLMVSTLSETMSCSFCRMQFTPDLLPADITGTKIYDHRDHSFVTKKGPIFSNLILADEINRAPPKVQSALLEAMQERQVSIQGDTYKLDRPFLVLATQNPIETEGTYRLPEAQVDRFMFKILVGYPDKKGEMDIIRRNTGVGVPKANAVIEPKDILKIQAFCREVYADEKIEEYIASLVDATRRPSEYGLDIDGHIDYGASPRASISLMLGGKAQALMNGRGYVIPEDVQAIAHEVLRHRILLTYEAEAEDVTPDQVVDKVLKKVKVP